MRNEIAPLHRMFRKGLSEETRFEQRPGYKNLGVRVLETGYLMM